MATFLLSIQQPDGDPPGPEVLEAVMRDVTALTEQMQAAGVLVFTGGLHDPAQAVVLRPSEGDLQEQQGPYQAGDEHLGGIAIVSAPDRPTAVEWAGRLARATTLPVEVREFQ